MLACVQEVLGGLGNGGASHLAEDGDGQSKDDEPYGYGDEEFDEGEGAEWVRWAEGCVGLPAAGRRGAWDGLPDRHHRIWMLWVMANMACMTPTSRPPMTTARVTIRKGSIMFMTERRATLRSDS